MSEHSEHTTGVVPAQMGVASVTRDGGEVAREQCEWQPYCVDCDEVIGDE